MNQQAIQQNIDTVTADLETLTQNRTDLQAKQAAAQGKRDFKTMSDLAGELQAMDAVIQEQQNLHEQLRGDLAALKAKEEREAYLETLVEAAQRVQETHKTLLNLDTKLDECITRNLEAHRDLDEALQTFYRMRTDDDLQARLRERIDITSLRMLGRAQSGISVIDIWHTHPTRWGGHVRKLFVTLIEGNYWKGR